MADEMMLDAVPSLDQVLGGATGDIVKQVREALLAYAAPSRGPADDLGKAAKLRGAFTTVQTWLIAHVMPDLNDAQWLFLSTGALGGKVEWEEKDGALTGVALLPDEVYAGLVKARAAKGARPAWAAPLLDYEDRVQAIARGELLGVDAGGARRRKPARPIGSDQVKVKVRARLETLLADVKNGLGAVETAVAGFAALREEKLMTGAKLNLEVLKKFAAIAGRAERNEQETKFLASVSEKLGALAASFGGLGGQLERAGRDLSAKGQALDGKVAEAKEAIDELDRIDAGQASAGAAFDQETITALRKDADAVGSFAIRTAENAENKVAFSGSRILVKEHWETLPGGPDGCLATVPAVLAALEKIGKLHLNMFPRDAEGAWALPTIVIEPIRNYVEYADDRIILSFAAGDLPRKGPKVSLSPLEISVLKGIGSYLTKDPLYDYRGEQNLGTFIGDYSGRIEKKTSTKWAGDDKKLTFQSTSQVLDSASRSDAINDYVDVFFCFANGMQPPQKLSRRKLAVLLRYCLLESVEKTIGYTLMYVVQSELAEAKETILKHAKTEEEAKAVVLKAFADPQVAKVCGDRDFFITKLFGKA